MKKLLLVLTAISVTFAAAAAEQTKKLKILMIGNSFSVCVGNDLHKLVKAEPDCKLNLTSAYIGGCTFNRHWTNITKAEKDPNFKPYRITNWNTDPKAAKKAYKDNVNNLLKEQWDVITIQQGSHESWDFKYYEPFAGNLIAYIKKHAPKAEIVIQQTWSYRVDAPRLKKWKMTQTEMYEKVSKAYQTLATKYQLRQIPMGAAVQTARKYGKYQTTAPTPEQDFSKLKYPEKPSFENDVVGSSAWRKHKKTQKMQFSADPYHLSRKGKYLQACTWFAFLYGKDANKIKYAPKDIKADDVAMLKKSAQEAVTTYKQVKK